MAQGPLSDTARSMARGGCRTNMHVRNRRPLKHATAAHGSFLLLARENKPRSSLHHEGAKSHEPVVESCPRIALQRFGPLTKAKYGNCFAIFSPLGRTQTEERGGTKFGAGGAARGEVGLCGRWFGWALALHGRRGEKAIVAINRLTNAQTDTTQIQTDTRTHTHTGASNGVCVCVCQGVRLRLIRRPLAYALKHGEYGLASVPRGRRS